MKKNKLYLSLIASVLFVLAFLWLVVRACSSNGIAEKSIYQIGRDSTWYPLDLRGKEKAMVGFSNDLIAEIGKIQNFKAIIFEVGPNALFDGLYISNYDAVLSSLTPNSMNRNMHAFSEPFYLVGPVLIVRKNSDIHSMNDLAGGKILGIASGALQQYDIPEPPDVVIIPYNTSATAMEKLDQNIIDGVLVDALRAYVWTEGFYSSRMKVVTPPLTTRGLRLIAKNNLPNIKWIDQFNAGLKELKENGVYRTLLKKWDLIDTELHETES